MARSESTIQRALFGLRACRALLLMARMSCGVIRPARDPAPRSRRSRALTLPDRDVSGRVGEIISPRTEQPHAVPRTVTHVNC